MRVRHQRWQNRRGTADRGGLDRLSAFRDRPAIISATFDPINHLPTFPTHVAGPKFGRAGFERKFPWVAQAVGPDFAAGARSADKGIVRRNSIREAGRPAVDIKPENRRFQVVDGLARVVDIGRRGRARVAGGNVEKSIRPDHDVAAAVAAAAKGEHRFARRGIEAERACDGDFEPQDLRAGEGRLRHPRADENLARLGKPRVKGDAEDFEFGKLGIERCDVGEENRRHLRRARIKVPDLAPAPDDEKALTVWAEHKVDGGIKREAGKHRRRDVGRRGLGCADQARGGPRGARRRCGRRGGDREPDQE